MPVYVPPSATTPYKSLGGVHFRQFVNDSVGSASLVSTPANSSTVVWLFVPISGTYAVQLLYGVGTTAATRMNNVRVQVGNVTVTSLTQLVAVNTLQAMTLILTVTTDQSIGLNVITGDTGDYVGSIVATQIG